MAADWYLQEWMLMLEVNQATLASRTNWGAARTNDIYHGRTEYYRAILNEAAAALGIRPYELLLHPEDAKAVRGLVGAARRLQLPDCALPGSAGREER